MKKIITCFLLAFCSSTVYADDAAIKRQQMEAGMEKLISIDREIEDLVRKRLKLRGDLAKHVEHGSVGLLPREGKRQSRQAGRDLEEIQEVNEQIERLNAERMELLVQLS